MRFKNKNLSKLLALFMTVMMCFGLLPNTFIQTVQAIEISEEIRNSSQESDYEIYPIPQNITYNDGDLNISSEVNVIFESGIDKATKNRLFEVLAIKNISYTVGTKIVEGKTNFLVGINNSNEVVDNYFNNNNIDSEEHFENIDAHIVSVKDNVVAVLGKDTDAAFYGITTLKLIFKQTESNKIRNLLIKDYSDGYWRGFIEGYYGIPWSNEDRMSLMKFGGDFKMNAYVFAPKDDPYHSGKWRDPYPEDKLKEIKEMVEVGAASKNKFIWSIHPFMNNAMRFDTEENYKEDLAKIITKFEQLYSVGVRQFGVLADDAGGDANNQVRLMSDLEEWRLSKDDVYNLIFVPKEYCASFAGWNQNSQYLKTINTMPETIEIMWTGDSVCGWVTTSTFEWFKTALTSEGNPGREAFMWLNWPVNDINRARLVMGKGQMLDPTVTNFRGILTNPMQEAEASKVALFAVADYVWHRDAFNDDKSWADSFKYIDEDASEELHTLSKHMSDPSPNGHGLVQDESEEIKPLLEEFNRKYSTGESIKEIGETLINEYEKIAKATIDFHEKSKNENLKEEIKPWTDSLKALAESAVEYIKAAIAIEEGNNSAVWAHYSEAAAKFELSKTFKVKNINGMGSVRPATKRLVPFVENLGVSLADKVSDIVNPGEEKLVITPYTNVDNVYQGSISNIVDGDLSTKVWFGRYIQEGDYVALELNKPTKITSLSIEQGKDATDKDAFHYGKFQYSMDGQEWIDVNDKTYGPYMNTVEANNLNFTAKFVRFIVTGPIKAEGEGAPKWASFREFSINKEINEGELSLTFFKSDNLSKRQGPDEAGLVTADGTTAVMYATNPYEGENRDGIPAGAYVGVDLGREAKLGRVHILGDSNAKGDTFKNAILEYSTDGVNYTELDTFTNAYEINENYSSREIVARYIRLRNLTQTKVWARFTKVYVEESDLNTNVYTNVPALASNKAKVLFDVATISDIKNITLADGEYIGIELPRIRDLSTIVAEYTQNDVLTLETSMNEIEWTEVDDLNSLEDARYIRIINKTENEVTFDISTLEVNSIEFKGREMSSTNFGSVENPNNAFDGSWTTQAWFKNNQDPGKYVTYDLGKTININSLKFVMNDYENDFIRNGKISLSEDGKTWTDAIIIGGDFGSDAKIEDIYPSHEVSYYTISARDLNVNARYLKIEITKSPNVSKWVRFNEIVINDGEYIPSENNPTFITNPIEVQGYAPTNLIDGDLNTTYKANTELSTSGSLVYRISKDTEITKIGVLQSPNTISNSVVSVRTVDGWTQIGVLDRSLNEFITQGLGNILEVKLEWNEVAPTLHEIITSRNEQVVNKNELEAKITEAKALDTTNWTSLSKKALENAILSAESVVLDVYASQNRVNDEIRALTIVMENPEIVDVNKDELIALYEANKDKKGDKYISTSFAVFEEALAEAKTVIDKEEATQEEVNEVKANLQEAIDGLKLKATNTLMLEIAVQVAEEVTEEELNNLVPAAAEAFRVALSEAKSVLSREATQEEVDTAFEDLRLAMQYLSFNKGDKTQLISLIERINGLNSNEYITETWEAMQIVLDKANEVVNNENALEYEVNDMYKELLLSFLNLRLKPSKDKLEDLINKVEGLDSSKYTEETWANVESSLTEAKNVMDNEEATKEEIDAAISLLQNSVNELKEKEDNSEDGETEVVNKDELVKAIEKANEYLNSADKYTNETYEEFLKALDEANKTKDNEGATQAMVDVATKMLNDAIASLVKVSVDSEDSEKPSGDNNSTGNGSGNSTGTGTGSNNGTGSSTGTSTPGKGQLPKTGAATGSIAYLGLTITVIGATLTKKRNK